MVRPTLVALILVLAGMPAAQAAAAKKVETQTITVPSDKVDPPAGKSAAGGPELGHGEDGLPALVAKTRKAILEAAYSGDLAALRAVMQRNETPPVVSVNEVGDAVEYLKSQSGDGEGLEVLAILTDILEAGWARTKAGSPQEMYVWPSFAARPVGDLTPAERVELYKIVTSSDYEEMKAAGKYVFYAVGIGPDGTWHYFKLMD
ncbi:hypothetical protein [Prosthecomicrobium sp. N25]|uniref:hypothetical protein n=1 Tax=Prosthecomicrobium sp. N25 TaxID=3129254 RepID=UPI003076D35B